MIPILLIALSGFLLWAHPVYSQDRCGIKNPTAQQLSECLNSNPIVSDLHRIINFLSAGVGVIVVIMIIIGGIQYITAGDNPQKVTEAKSRITNALIALVVFLFMAAFLQWLVPGGIFNG